MKTKRLKQLTKSIKEFYGEPCEIRIFEGCHGARETIEGMIEIKRASSDSCDAEVWTCGTLIKQLRFDQKVHPHIESGDVFLATVALKDRAWRVVHASPPFETEVF